MSLDHLSIQTEPNWRYLCVSEAWTPNDFELTFQIRVIVLKHSSHQKIILINELVAISAAYRALVKKHPCVKKAIHTRWKPGGGGGGGRGGGMKRQKEGGGEEWELEMAGCMSWILVEHNAVISCLWLRFEPPPTVSSDISRLASTSTCRVKLGCYRRRWSEASRSLFVFRWQVKTDIQWHTDVQWPQFT